MCFLSIKSGSWCEQCEGQRKGKRGRRSAEPRPAWMAGEKDLGSGEEPLSAGHSCAPRSPGLSVALGFLSTLDTPLVGYSGLCVDALMASESLSRIRVPENL